MKWSSIAVLVLLMVGACASQVGDACETNTECGTELVCELGMSGGYCTKTPCEANGCPEEAVCITFDDDSTYCMLRCESNGDCRDSQVCVKDYGASSFCNDSHYVED